VNRRFSIERFFLWLFVIVLGIEIGAGLYETLVVVPLWSASPPDSVVAYYQHNTSNPQLALNPGGRFWMVNTPLVGLLAVAALLSGLKTRPEHRRWRIVATRAAIIVVAATFAWFVPNIMILNEGGRGLSADQIASLSNWWVRLNWVRVVVYSTGWLAGLCALTVPSS